MQILPCKVKIIFKKNYKYNCISFFFGHEMHLHECKCCHPDLNKSPMFKSYECCFYEACMVVFVEVLSAWHIVMTK